MGMLSRYEAKRREEERNWISCYISLTSVLPRSDLISAGNPVMELFESRLSRINLIHSGGHQRQSLFVIAPGRL